MTVTVSPNFTPTSELENLQTQTNNFTHLYWDIAWFGVAFGSTLSFLAIFAARLGAAGWQIALLSGGPALMNVLFTLPAGRWLESRPLQPSVVRAAITHRLGYLILAPLPLLLPDSFQVWSVLLLLLLMAIPGSALAVGFNALLATTVPPEHRGHVVGRRNAMLSVAIMLTFLLCGWLLDQLSFEWGYTVVFGLGALGSLMSTYHLYRIRIEEKPHFEMHPLGDKALPGRTMAFGAGLFQRLSISPRMWLQWRPSGRNTFANVSRQYWRMMLAFMLFHFTQFLPVAIYPIFLVRDLALSDRQISWVNAIYFLTMLATAPFLGRLTQRFGNFRLTVWGAFMLCTYPLITAFSSGIAHLIVANMIIGFTWAIMSGSLLNRMFEVIPDDQRPPHLALYNMALNIATLSGTMLGPVLAGAVGLREALLLMAAARLFSGLVVSRWG